MLDENRIDEILTEICEHHGSKRNGGFNAKCPVCGDSAKKQRLRRLHIDWYQKYDDWVVTCYNGGCQFHSGNIYSLYANVTGVSYGEAKKYIDQSVYDTEDIKRRLSKKTIVAPVEDPQVQVLDLDMADCLSVDDTPEDRVQTRYVDALKQFIKDRYITNPCYVAHQGRYKNRFIIPIYINDEMVYFQGRSMNGSLTPKYLNPIVDKSTIIMNRDKFDRSKSIIVTEGIIDSWMIEGNQGTSVLGAYFDDDIIEQLLTMTDKSVILCFDNPLIDESGRKVLTQHISESMYKNKVKYFLPDRKDFKDLNELRCAWSGNIYDYIIDNSFSSLNVKVKLSLLYK